MFEKFKKFAEEFLSEIDNGVTDSKANYFITLKHELKPSIETVVGKNYMVKYSVGQGNKTYYPWIAIFNPAITLSAQRGMYIVYLFKRDLSGVYLTLNQGITNFKDLYGHKAYEYANQVADYFRGLIESPRFSKNRINLLSESQDKGFGYEQTNIISKYYDFSELNYQNMNDDLLEIVKIYDLIYDSMSDNDYQQIIDIIVENESPDDFYDAESAKEVIELINQDKSLNDIVEIYSLSEVEVPKSKTKRSVTVIKKRKIPKKNYLEQAKKDTELGLIGEFSVLEFEKERLKSIGLDEYINKIKWVSKESDQYGYDIKSFDKYGEEVKEIFIEVKTTKAKGNQNFYVSKHEVDISEMYKERYFIYRIHEVEGSKAKIYIQSGSIAECFDLEPYSYTANIKNNSK